MKKPSIFSYQQGFAPVEALLLLVIVALLGFTGYYVYTSSKKATETLSAASNIAQNSAPTHTKKKSAQTTAPTNASTATVSSTGTFLVIKEWGVKLPLTTNIAAAYYHYENRDSGYAYVSIKPFIGTACAADATTLGAFSRVKPADEDPLSGMTYGSMYPDAPKIGDYLYIFTHPQSSCSDSQAVLAQADTAMKEFQAASQKLQAE